MKAPHFSAVMRLSELVATAQRVIESQIAKLATVSSLLLDTACAPGPRHAGSPPPPHVAEQLTRRSQPTQAH